MGDRAGLIHWANGGWRELIGMPRDESIGKPIGSLLEQFSVDPGVVSYVSRRFLAGKTCEVEFPFQDPSGERRWLHVRVNPSRDADGEVTRFVAVARDISAEIEQGQGEVDECDLASLVRRCAIELAPELGPRAGYDVVLGEDLPPAYADREELSALVRHLIRRGARAIGDEWGIVSLTVGLVGLGEEPIGTHYLAAGLPVGPYLFVEVHDTGVTSLAEATSRLSEPFLPGRHGQTTRRFPNALQLVEELGGRMDLQHDEPFGSGITIVLPA
jgi:PAS domain S-box-containing protein